MRYASEHMRFAWLSVLAAAVVAFAPGCGDSAPESTVAPVHGIAGPNATLAFEVDGTLALAPGETPTLRVKTSPPASYEIAFALLGDALDATLDRTVTVAGADGIATVKLRAPSAATTFRLRATIKDGPSADVGVSVSDKGFGTLRIIPKYSGNRAVEQWVGSVVAHTSCAELAPILPGEADGALMDSAKADATPIEIAKAPVGPSLAIAVRAGHYIVGCVDEADLVAGSQLDVTVPAVDVPMKLDATSLDLTLAFEPEPDPWNQLLSGATSLLLDAYMPTTTPEATTLLDAMAAALAAGDQATFGAERIQLGWDAAVTQYLDSRNVSMRALAAGWATAGVTPSPSGLLGHLSAVDDVQGLALLSVSSFAGVDAAALGIPATHLVAWNADPGDTVHLAGTVFWMPSRFVGAAVLTGAKATVPDLPPGATVVDAIERSVACADLAAVLGSSLCDVTCIAALCQQAIAARWTLGLEASATATQVGQIGVSAAGAALVDDEAVPISFEGSWIGTVTDGLVEAPVSGDASGVETPAPGPPQ